MSTPGRPKEESATPVAAPYAASKPGNASSKSEIPSCPSDIPVSKPQCLFKNVPSALTRTQPPALGPARSAAAQAALMRSPPSTKHGTQPDGARATGIPS
jgi:hypothetical protein